MGFLEEYDIDAYEFLGVSDFCQDKNEIRTAYKEKSLLLHPDKTMGKTEVEFKILHKCYKFAMRNIMKKEKSHIQLKEESKEDILPVKKNPENNLHLFETDRDLLFHDDTLDRDFENTIKRVSGLSTSYSPIDNTYDTKFRDSLSNKGKFNREKFNVLFSELKKTKTSNELLKYTGPIAYNELEVYINVHTGEDGTMLNSTDEPETSKEPKINQSELDMLLKLDSKTIDKLSRKHKKDTGKMSRKKIKEAISSRSSVPEITEKRSFSQMEIVLEENKLKALQSSAKAQHKFVDKHKIYRCIE
jgi:hypothetical protein